MEAIARVEDEERPLRGDAERAAAALADAGFRIERPPEDWLVKAWLGPAMVDVLHGVRGEALTSDALAAGERRNFVALLPPAQAVREQID